MSAYGVGLPPLDGVNVVLMACSEAYLHYIRRQNPITEGSPNVEATRVTVTKAYEFALKECGSDRESGDIWQEYVSFLGEPSVS
jgi:cleavage stimulation factor subunit 3